MNVERTRGLAGWRLERATQAELLDLGQGTDRDVAENLAEMQRINDRLGGTRALTRYLYPRLLLLRGPVTVLDLGTGGAGFPLALARWARNLRLPLRVLAVDWSARNLAVARQNLQPPAGEVQLIQADALHLPLAPGQVDYVISSLFLHHLEPEELARLLAQAYRLARRGVIMSDLVRGVLPLVSFDLISPIFARNYLTRHDGALSVRRAYTPRELYRIAARAGLPMPKVYSHFPWRMTLVVDRGERGIAGDLLSSDTSMVDR